MDDEVKNEGGLYSSVFIKEELDFISGPAGLGKQFNGQTLYQKKFIVENDSDTTSEDSEAEGEIITVYDDDEVKVIEEDDQVKVSDEEDDEIKFNEEEDDEEMKFNLAGGDFKRFEVKQETSDDCDSARDDGVLSDVDIKHVQELADEPYLSTMLNRESDKSKFHCDYCSLSTKFVANLRRHIKTKHLRQKAERKYFCNRCPFSCLYRNDFMKHTLRHDGKFMFNCYFCKYGINRKNRIVQHIIKQHVLLIAEGTFKKMKKCYYCTFKTKVKCDMLSHILDNHGMDFKSRKRRQQTGLLPCGLCSYSADTKNRLINHIDSVHKKIKLYPCNLCSYGGSKPSELLKHVNAKHKKITPFKCDSCRYATAYKTHLRRHITTQHMYKKPRKPHTKRRSTARVKTERIVKKTECI